MKNILIYAHPDRKFEEESINVTKIQIENMLDMGWKSQDIILLTNFPYEHQGIKSIVAGEDIYHSFSPWLAKIHGIVFLFEQGLLENDEIYFCHDFDYFQVASITESEIKEQLGQADVGLTDYGRVPRWHLSCAFFKKSAQDIFKLLLDTVLKTQMHSEEDALFMLTEADTKGIKSRIKKLNIRYNFWGGNIRSTYPMAEKPIKGIHFQPYYQDRLEFFMYGKNKIGKVLIDERLIKLLNKYGFK